MAPRPPLWLAALRDEVAPSSPRPRLSLNCQEGPFAATRTGRMFLELLEAFNAGVIFERLRVNH
jgi:hypothetical protein